MTQRDGEASRTSRAAGLAAPGLLLLLLAACEPSVRLEAPREPITINLNIKADVRVRIEELAQKDIRENEDIF